MESYILRKRCSGLSERCSNIARALSKFRPLHHISSGMHVELFNQHKREIKNASADIQQFCVIKDFLRTFDILM